MLSSSRQQPLVGRQSNIDNDQQQQDHAVKSTADDAILHKLSCVEMGYYDDPFVHAMSRGASGLVKKKQQAANLSGGKHGRHPHHPHVVGRSSASSTTEPIIRRGTHARVKAIDRAVDAFLSLPLSSSKGEAAVSKSHEVVRQVVVLGSGRDTTYLRHRFGKKDPPALGENATVQWYEVDHPSVIIQKAHSWLPGCIPQGYIYKCDANEKTGNSYTITISPSQKKEGSDSIDDDGNSSQSSGTTSNYHLIGHDLRSSPSALFETLCHPKHGYNRSLSTLFVLECVLMYMPEETTWDLLRYLAESPSSSSSVAKTDDPFVAVVIYDPIPSNDRFGQLMIDNLQKAGIMGRRKRGHQRHVNDEHDDQDMPQQLSLEKTQTLSDQLQKLIKSGFDMAAGCDMMAAYNHGVLSMEDCRRAARCEMLDELEEFNLLMKHYCLVVGVSALRTKMSLEEEKDRMNMTDSIGLQLCSVGKDSLMGFQEGHCTTVKR